MMNVYNGLVTSDENGEAVVTLPDYFEALNVVSGYQLTVIGRTAQAIVAREVEDNRFTVQTTEPRVKVSWQVTGTRRDPWAVANRITVEEGKSPQERGRYLYPALYGRPKEAGIRQGSRRVNQPDQNGDDGLDLVRNMLPERSRELMELRLQPLAAGDDVEREQRDAVAKVEQRVAALPAAPPPMDAERLEEHRRKLTEVTERIRRSAP